MARSRSARPTTARRPSRHEVDAKTAGKTADSEPVSRSKPKTEPLEPEDSPSLSLDPADVVDTPEATTGLGPQGEAGAMPEPDRPEAGGSHKPLDDLADRGVESQKSEYDAPEVADEDPAGLDGIDEILAGKASYGGADGRNDASDLGGTGDGLSGDPIGGLHGGDEPTTDTGMFGKVPPEHQAVLDALKEEAQKAVANGDYEGAEAAAEKTHQFLVDNGYSEPTPETGPSVSLIPGFGSASSDSKPAWDEEKGEVVMVEQGTKTDTTGSGGGGGGLNPAGQSGTSGSSGQSGTSGQSGSSDSSSPPPATGGQNEDRGVESEEGPEIEGLDDFTDQYRAHTMATTLGADVDPDPTDDPGGMTVEFDPVDGTDLTAEYEDGYVEVTHDLDAATAVLEDSATPDEEFMDADA